MDYVTKLVGGSKLIKCPTSPDKKFIDFARSLKAHRHYLILEDKNDGTFSFTNVMAHKLDSHLKRINNGKTNKPVMKRYPTAEAFHRNITVWLEIECSEINIEHFTLGKWMDNKAQIARAKRLSRLLMTGGRIADRREFWKEHYTDACKYINTVVDAAWSIPLPSALSTPV